MGKKKTIVNIIGGTVGSVSVGDGSSSTGHVTGSGSSNPTPADPPAQGSPAAPKSAGTSEADTPIDFAILTAIEVERKAVCAAFGLGREHRVRKDGRTYWRGQLALTGGETYQIVVAQPRDMGQVEAALLASDVIKHWQPAAALLVGIAASTDKDIKLGDVVVGRSVWYFEHGKVTAEGTQPQPEMILADAALLDAATGLDWDGAIEIERPDGTDAKPRRHFGVIASGEKVIAHVAARDAIVAGNRKIVALEMEGYGFSRAIWQSFERVRHLDVRGICDEGSEEKNDRWRSYSAAAAARYAKHFLSDGPLAPRIQRGNAIGTEQPNSRPSNESNVAQVQGWRLKVLYFHSQPRKAGHDWLRAPKTVDELRRRNHDVRLCWAVTSDGTDAIRTAHDAVVPQRILEWGPDALVFEDGYFLSMPRIQEHLLLQLERDGAVAVIAVPPNEYNAWRDAYKPFLQGRGIIVEETEDAQDHEQPTCRSRTELALRTSRDEIHERSVLSDEALLHGVSSVAVGAARPIRATGGILLLGGKDVYVKAYGDRDLDWAPFPAYGALVDTRGRLEAIFLADILNNLDPKRYGDSDNDVYISNLVETLCMHRRRAAFTGWEE